MESKALDSTKSITESTPLKQATLSNKKLTKALFITGFGVLILFIIVRLVFKSQGDHVTDMPEVGELTYKPKRIEEKSKTEEFEQQRMEKQQKEMGYEENNYVVPNFNELTKKNENTVANIITPISPTIKTTSNSENRSNHKTEQTAQVQATYTTPGSKLNYRSEYFSGKNGEATQPITPQNQAGNGTTTKTKNPFGTISTENNSQGQKMFVNTVVAFQGEIYGDQKIENGGNVMIRNTQTIQYNSITIPKNSILYGQASFRDNRVYIKINRVKTSSGEFSVLLSVLDNDRLEGIYYKAPIDETVDKAPSDVNLPQIPGNYGGVLNSVSQTVLRSGKDMMKKNNTLNLEEGYRLFIVPLKSN